MNKTFKYCNIAKTMRTSYPSQSARNELSNPLNRKGIGYQSLEDKIRIAQETGEDVGIKVAVEFDDEEINEIDVLGSFNHDNFDIAQLYGKMLDNPTPPADDTTPPAGEGQN